MPSLVEQVKAIEAQATTARQGRDEAMGKVAQQATEIERLKAEYAAERAQLKASSTATQQDYQQLKASHEAALAELTASKAQAAKVPELVDQLKAARQEAINTKLTADERYKNLRCQALEIQAERNELAKKVATLSVAPRTQTPAPVHQVQAQPERPAPRPTPAPTVQAPTQAVLQPDTAQAYVWPKLTEEQFQALPTRQLGDRVIAAAREVLVMCVQVADAAAKQKLFPAQVVRALENLLENYREPAKPVPEQQQPLAAAPARTQTPTPSRGGLGR